MDKKAASGNVTQPKIKPSSNHIFANQPFIFLISGLIFVLFYFIMARDLKFFIPADFTCFGGPQRLIPISDDLTVSYIRHFHPRFLASFFWKALLLIPAAVLLSAALTIWIDPEWLDKITNRLESLRPGVFIAIFSLLALIVIVILIGFVYDKTYITDDENAYVFQAKILEKGAILAPPPPIEKSFDNIFIITEKVFTGKYTLGFPFLLSLGLRLAGNAYLFPVLLAACSIWLFFLLGREFYDAKTGVLASAILTCSPFFLFNASNLLSHASNLFFLTFFAWTYIRGLRRDSWLMGLISGLAFGVAFNIRQLTALGFGCPFAFYLLWRIKKKNWTIPPFTPGFMIGALPVFFLTLWYNRLISGSFFRFPFNVFDPLERLGFGAMLNGLRYTHTPLKGIQNLLVSAGRLNLWFLGTPVSLVFLLPVLFRGARQKGDLWCLGILLCFFVSYLFYYSPGVADTGPVYYFELLLPLSLLSARGLLIAYHKMRSQALLSPFRAFIPLFFSFSILLGFLSFLPEQSLRIRAMTDRIKEPYNLVEKVAEKPAMVFIRSLPLVGWVFGYRSVDPWLKAPILYCKDLGPEKNLEVIERFPDRNYYILYFDGKKDKNLLSRFTKEDLVETPVIESVGKNESN